MAKDLRLDLQVLRALAVGAVVLYHLFPDFIPTGLLGVDVFFVLSGYLITGLLWRDLQDAKGLRDITARLTRFWARRARRLIPAALIVLLVTAAIGFFVAPSGWWLEVSGVWIWAVAYMANWFLANEAADYLRADAAVSPYQHYWSLSVEEQFYILLPILLGVLLLFVMAKRLSVVTTLLATLTILSLGYAVFMQGSDPAYGFYSSLTRIWEFGAGGLLALLQAAGKLASPPKRIFSLVWLGLFAVMLIPHDPHLLVFHNLAAVVLSVLAIWVSQGRFEKRAYYPLVRIGDYSYSIYLWHWPILVISPWVLGVSILSSSLKVQALALIVILLVAIASKHLIEDPIRFGSFSRVKSGTQVLLTVLVTASLVVGGHVFYHNVYLSSKANAVSFSFTPTLTDLRNDKSIAEDAEYIIRRDQEGFTVARFGNLESPTRIALVGDSHARQYYPALELLAAKYDFGFEMISKSACSVQDPSNYQLAPFGGGLFCKEWNQSLEDHLASTPYALLINTNSTLVNNGGAGPAKSFVDEVAKWQEFGQKVLLIRDNAKPSVADAVSDFRYCIEQFGDDAVTKCSTPIDRALTPNDTLFDQGSLLPGVTSLDLTSLLCPDGISCPVIMDNMIVYRDGSHMSLTFSKTLATPLETKLLELGILKQ